MDLILTRLTIIVCLPGSPEQTTEIVYNYQNRPRDEVSNNSVQRQHRVLRLLPTMRSVRFNMKVEDAGGQNLVVFNSEFTRGLALQRALGLAAQIRTILNQNSTQYERARNIIVDFTKRSDIYVPADELLDAGDIEACFPSVSDVAVDDNSVAIVSKQLEGVKLANKFVRAEALDDLVNKLLYWVLLHRKGYVPLVQLPRPIGYENDDDEPNHVMIKHVESTMMDPYRQQRRKKSLWRWLGELFGFYRITIHVPFHINAASIHYQVSWPEKLAGLRLMSVRFILRSGLVLKLGRQQTGHPLVEPGRFGYDDDSFHHHLSSQSIAAVMAEMPSGTANSDPEQQPFFYQAWVRDNSTSLALWATLVALSIAYGITGGEGLVAALVAVLAPLMLYSVERPVLRRRIMPRLLITMASFAAALAWTELSDLGSWMVAKAFAAAHLLFA